MSGDEEEAHVPLPAGAEVEHLGPDVALLSFPLPEPVFPPELTAAERDVALRVFRGATNAAIARERGVSAKTIANQLESIYRKAGVTSRCELVLRLLQR
ncbi:MAG: helix-turn-helix transcriptional regulator [Labilithrix sp.]|nr:helix-turn-helix transcriptional regulator [Labilithrix sp.]MCW5815237.1 helix-turn-helix transcriptional regulator [Labilithrix sp.]